MAYWISYSGHQPYSLDTIGVKEEHVNMAKTIYPELDDEHVAFWVSKNDMLSDGNSIERDYEMKESREMLYDALDTVMSAGRALFTYSDSAHI